MVGLALLAVVISGFVLAALSPVGLLVPASRWPMLVMVAATASILMLSLFFSPQLVLGFAIDLALLWLVLGSGWSPTAGAEHAAGLSS